MKVSASKPELPPFLQRIREQLVADEDADRREQSDRKRKSRPIRSDDPDDAPELVRVGDEEITEEEFERMKKGKLNSSLDFYRNIAVAAILDSH